ncbi:MAG: division plane positioning ATPase MipZ [Actinomycetota bacterium]
MDLQHVIRTFRRRWRPIVVLALLGAALGAASAAVQEDAAPAAVPVVRYDACHTLLVDDAIPNDVPQWDVRNLPQLAERVTQGEIPRAVAEATGNDVSTAATHVRVGVRTDIGSLVTCSVGETPVQAEELADGFSQQLILVLEADAQEYYDRSLASAESRIIDAQACVDEANRGNITAPADGVTALDSAQQQVSLCELQLIDARTDEITLRAGGVPVVPFETLESASAQEISERDYDAHVRAGAAGANVTSGSSESVGTGTPAASGSGGTSSSGLAANPFVRIALGFGLGMALGVGYVQFTERLDSRLRRKDDVERTLDLPVLAEIPPLGRSDRKGTDIISVIDPRSRSAESFRALRSAIDYAHAVDQEAGRARPGAIVVLVTSGAPSEGKTTTISNLAAVMAEGDRRVLAVNCDFRRPRLHRYLGGPTAAQRLNVTDIPGVQMVTQVTPNDAEASPSDVVGAQRRLVERARDRFDVILLDTAPILTTNDAAELLGVCDHVILVVSAGNTKAEAAARATELLERRGRPPLGVALVGTRDVPNSADYYYSDDDPYLVSSSKSKRRQRRRTDDAATDEPMPAEVQAGG